MIYQTPFILLFNLPFLLISERISESLSRRRRVLERPCLKQAEPIRSVGKVGDSPEYSGSPNKKQKGENCFPLFTKTVYIAVLFYQHHLLRKSKIIRYNLVVIYTA